MKPLAIFTEVFRILRHHWVVWILSILLVLSRDTIPQMLPEDLVFGCPLAILALVSLIAEAALISVVFRAHTRLPISLRDIWESALSLLSQAFILSLIIVIAMFFLGGLFYVFRLLLQLESPSRIDWLLRSLLLIPFVVAFSAFAFCGLVVHKLSPLKSAWNSLLISTSNLHRIIPLVAIFVIARLALIIVLILLVDPLNWQTNLSHFPFIDSQIRLALSNNLVVWGLTFIGSLLLTVAETPVYTLVYLSLIKEIPYPWLGDKTAV